MSSYNWPSHLLTIEEWGALPEDGSRRFELAEGVLQMSPRPVVAHQVAVTKLAAQLNEAFGSLGWFAVIEVDVAVVESFPPTVRAPDIAVASTDVLRPGPKMLRATEVRLAVEFVSPGSRRVDRVMKLAEYAEAGIPSYWIVDIDGQPTLDAFTLVDGSYKPSIQAGTGTLDLVEPVPLSLDLNALVL
jgi:Uma2 family endonuclease